MDDFEFIWTISNFNFLPVQRGKAIKSPSFNVSGLGSIFIELYPKGDILDPKGTCAYISLSKDNISNIHVLCECTLTRGDFKSKFEPEKYHGPTKWKFSRDKPLTFQDGSSLNVPADGGEITLTITCTFTQHFAKRTGSFCGRKSLLEEDKIDMAALVCDMKDIHISQQLTDLILVAESKEFPVHKAILQARAPKLFEEIKHKMQTIKLSDQRSESEKLILGMKAEIVEMLLNYIYSGEIPATTVNIPTELYVAADLYGLNELKQLLYCYPTSMKASTIVKFDHRVFLWVLPNINKLRYEKSFTPAFAGGIVLNSDFKLCCCIINNQGQESMEIQIQRINPDMNTPVLVVCKISCNQLPDLKHSAEHLFLSDIEWVYPTFLQIKTEGNDLYLGNHVIYKNGKTKEISFKCEIYVSGINVSDIVETNYLSYMNEKGQDNLQVINLCHDLGQLYNIFLPKFSDVTLKAENVNFPAHKAILAARSPVFARMFDCNMQEKERGIVEIVDIEHAILYMMLTYIYSAKLDVVSFDSAFKLYTAADKYEIMSLRNKCATNIMASISVENVCDVLILSYMHEDILLKTVAEKFVYSNIDVVLGGEEWQKLIESHPTLATEFLKGVTSFVLKRKLATC